MLKEAYDAGVRYAFEKFGDGTLGPAMGTAGMNVDKSFNVKMTKSVDNQAGLTTGNTNNAIGPKRASPKLSVPKAFMGMPK